MSKINKFFDIVEFDYELEKQRFIDNLDMLKNMSVQEQTLYRKYKEVNEFYRTHIDKARTTKAKIWVPKNITDRDSTIQEIQDMKPRIRLVNGKMDESDWLSLRVFSHTMEFDQNPGRFLRFLVYDETTEKYLGAVSLGSDVISVKCRDEWIGWSREERIDKKKLSNSAIGTCIMATQPFGYNFLGGKLVASLLTTKAVSDVWESMYGNVLVGITTTSLYGPDSMYNGIPFWKNLGVSSGSIGIKPDDDVYKKWHHWLKENKWDEYDKRANKKERTEHGPVTGVKQQIISMMFRELGVKPSKYKHGFERGVYYAQLYENTKEFLKGEIEKKDLIQSKRLINDTASVVDWWKPKAIKRFDKLHSENRIKPEILYYTDLIGTTWSAAKKLYLPEVGR